MFVVLPLLVATVLQQMWHTGLSRLSSVWIQSAPTLLSRSALKPIPSLFSFQISTCVTSGLLLLTVVSCYSVLCQRRSPASPHRDEEWLTRGFTWETQGKQTSMQMEIIEAGEMIELILIYRTINWFIDYRDRPRWDDFDRCVFLTKA